MTEETIQPDVMEPQSSRAVLLSSQLIICRMVVQIKTYACQFNCFCLILKALISECYTTTHSYHQHLFDVFRLRRSQLGIALPIFSTTDY